MTSRLAALARDERGGTYGEFLIVIIPMLAFGLGIFQLSELYTAKMAVDHAALNAARSASVVFADDPKSYGGEGTNRESEKRSAAVRLAALRTVAPYVLDGSIQSLDVKYPDGVPTHAGAPMTVEVRAKFRCSVPLVHRIVCVDGGMKEIASRQTFASQAASFSYSGGGGGGLAVANP